MLVIVETINQNRYALTPQGERLLKDVALVVASNPSRTAMSSIVTVNEKVNYFGRSKCW